MGGVVASGRLMVSVQATNSDITISIDTSTAGSKDGTAAIGLVSDGTGINSWGQTTLSSQSVNVTVQFTDWQRRVPIVRSLWIWATFASVAVLVRRR